VIPKNVARMRPCRDLAASTSNATASETFLNLASTWEWLAAELESAAVLLETLQEIEPKKSPRLAANFNDRSNVRHWKDHHGNSVKSMTESLKKPTPA
jgi:hypothetical protein